jgi:O-antigen/teichoic acid export membrane protein
MIQVSRLAGAWPRTSLQKASAQGLTAVRSGLPFLIVSIFFVQGLAYISQLVLATFLGPADFGIVRTVEAYLSIALIVGTAGMNSLAVTTIAEAGDPAVRASLLARLLVLALGVSLLCAAIICVILTFVDQSSIAHYLRALIWAIGLTACSRTCFNYFQGIKQIKQYALSTAIASVVSLIAITVPTYLGGLRGWIFGRYAAEAAFLTLAVILVRKRIAFRPLPSAYSWTNLGMLGASIALALLVRTALDNAAVLSLSWFGRSKADIGYYGLGNILSIVLSIIPAGIANIALPRFAESRRDPERVRQLFWRVTKWSLALMGPIVVLAVLASRFLIRLLSERYAPSVPVLQILLLQVPFRLLAIIAAAALMGLNRNDLTVICNVLLLGLALAFYAVAIPRFGVVGAAWATFIIETFGGFLYLRTVLWVITRERARLSKFGL